MMSRALLTLLLAACAFTVQAQQPPAAAPPEADARSVAVERVARNWHLRIGAALADSGQPRELALAALLYDLAGAAESGGDDPAPGWRRRADAAAGNDVVTHALLVTQPEAAADAGVRERAAQRWASAEPDNVAPLLYRDGGVDALLVRAGSMRRFDLHMYPQVRWIRDVLLRHPPTANEQAVLFGGDTIPMDEYAAMTAMGLWTAAALPPLDTLLEACDGAALRVAGRRDGCDRIARVLIGDSDTNLGRMVGIDMLARVAATASGRAEVQALQRRMDWQMLEWGRIAAAQPRDGAPQFARLLRDPQVRSEQDLVERILAEAGVAPDPPAAWQPPRR